MGADEMKNRLDGETSPYLLEHADNPVAWQPWDDRALELAREGDRPIFLSIGYSACHWCHVMARESFEDSSIASYLNEHFVPIKVDREERPDLDRIYMHATQMMTGQGGWPMSVFLTPELEPFYAGTYFPPEDKWGRPGFETILERVVELWETDRARVEDIGGEVTEKIDQLSESETGGELDRQPVRALFEHWQRHFDERYGGTEGSPKFPPAMQLRALLKMAARGELDSEERNRAVEMVERTLVRMASGGMYDQIGGGFHRYSTDTQWLVPHFEKMLYDNALLTMAYVDAHRTTGRNFYRRIVDETLSYVEREMTYEGAERGAPFYSTQDAESEGEEGKYFVWTPEQLREVLDETEAERAEAYWGITASGNFENDWSIPNRLQVLDDEGEAGAFEEIPDDVRTIRERLLEAREERTAPATDTKVLASWNGLMVRAMAYAGSFLDDASYIESAERAGRFLHAEMVEGDLDGEFELMRTYKDGRARISGYLDDYALVAAAWLELFEAGCGLEWLDRAERLVDRMLELFWDAEDGGFYYTAEHHEHLIVRDKDQMDNQLPSGNSAAVGSLLRSSLALGRPELRDRAEEAMEAFYGRMCETPHAMGEMIQWLDFHLGEPLEVAVVVPEGEDAGPLEEVLRERHLPHLLRVRVDGKVDDEWVARVPLLEGRESQGGEATVFVCREGACRTPATAPDELRAELEAVGAVRSS